MGKTFSKILTIGVVIILCLGFFTACGSTHGVPHGTYHSCNEDGVITKGAPETAWQIKDGAAELLYLKYMISDVDGKVYFEREASDSILARKFEVKFDKRTKILSVYMPSDFASDTHTGEVKAHYYKKQI